METFSPQCKERFAKSIRALISGEEAAMRPFLVGIAAIAVLTVVDYSLTGGFYTSKFTEMSEKIVDSFRR
jgi:hypothetical protein